MLNSLLTLPKQKRALREIFCLSRVGLLAGFGSQMLKRWSIQVV